MKKRGAKKPFFPSPRRSHPRTSPEAPPLPSCLQSAPSQFSVLFVVFGGSTEVVVEGKEDLFLFLPWFVWLVLVLGEKSWFSKNQKFDQK